MPRIRLKQRVAITALINTARIDVESLDCLLRWYNRGSCVLLASLCSSCSRSAPPARGRPLRRPKPDPFSERTEGADTLRGLLTLHVDGKAGKVWLEVPARPTNGIIGEFLYYEGLVSGLGSNPVGLDRGQLGDTRVVTLKIQAGRLLVEQQNLDYRAVTTDANERRATRQSFASSVLWAGKVEATAKDGRRLIDLTSFIVRDAHGVRAALRRADQGEYALDPDRSVVDTDHTLVFADNVELEGLVTYKSDKAGKEVEATAANGTAFSLTLRHSLVRLPSDGYRPRAFHPRSGSFGLEFADYAAPLDRPLKKRWLVRHRLSKVEPIVYYVDPGIPEPIRSAVIDGASWWKEAFAAAGFPDGFKVEVLPADAHPLDIRYNVIQWVHRATRGWSYGSGVVDPRTGEMIKGHVSLGSLRVRQDRRIFEGLLGAAMTGTGQPDDPIQLALARIRQLAAHEVGHTLGFAHNFAASVTDRASVMDYPAPLATVRDNKIDLSKAYDVGIGEWDVIATRYAYTDLPPGDEAAGLAAILKEADEAGLVFLTDQDARPPGAAHPLANLWDNGPDPAAALDEALAVRRLAIDAFGPSNLRPGQPLALLEETFAPIYFYHRYQLDAAAKAVGGLLYTYPLADDVNATVKPVDAETQRKALRAVLSAMSPAALDIPEKVAERLVPRAYGLDRNRELFGSSSSPGFDALAAARTAAGMVVSGLLQRERAARLVDQHRRDPTLPGLGEIIGAIVDDAFATAVEAPRQRQLQDEVRTVVVTSLMALARDPHAPWSVRAEADQAVAGLVTRVPGTAAFSAFLRNAIRRFSDRGFDTNDRTAAAPRPPPPARPSATSGPAATTRYRSCPRNWCEYDRLTVSTSPSVKTSS